MNIEQRVCVAGALKPVAVEQGWLTNQQFQDWAIDFAQRKAIALAFCAAQEETDER